MAADINQGLKETIGHESEWIEGRRGSVRIYLPSKIDTRYIARAVDEENIKACLNPTIEESCFFVGIGP